MLGVEVEAVGDADGDDERPGQIRVELDGRPEAFRRRARSEVVEPDRRAAHRERQVVGMADVGVHAS